MSANPEVSVIIPSYNCEAYIAETLGSIVGQSFRDIEVIVVDDGSTDRTRDIVAAWGDPVRLIAQQNAGVCAARNRGIREARGRFICLVDHDDYWYPDKLERQLRQMAAHPEVGVVYSSFILWHREAGGEFPAPAGIPRPGGEDEIVPDFSGWIYHQFLIDCWMLTSTALFRREVFERCGAFDETLPYSEDWDLWLRISRDYPFVKLARADTLYRQHPQQGNRVARPIDYRTRLLAAAADKWGLASPDGKALAADDFNRRLALYHSEYGRHQLQAGHVGRAAQAFLKAWRRHPGHIKYPLYVAAAMLGWRAR